MTLAWVKFKDAPRAGVIAVFVTSGIVIITYLQANVRQRFKFPEQTHRKPSAFLLNDGFDPEHGKVKAQLKSAY